MTKIIFTCAIGVVTIGGISLFLIWIDRRSKKRAAKFFNERFQYLDDYYNYYNEFEDISKR